ncbi:MAG: protoheme IX farnesyltransferase [Planctomycetes bacterium]|nr:protoheme IX farnesyltransferase [Planctomycetota bacterium]
MALSYNITEAGEETPDHVNIIKDILVMGKARICAMAVFTGYAAIAVEGQQIFNWPIVLSCITAMFFMGMGANTLNQIIEKDKDATMFRTRKKRPLPSGRISLPLAWCIAAVEILGSLALLAFVHHSWLAVGLAAFTVLYYGVFYTMILKPRHYLNIVIGGVPGAMGPLIAWAAVANELSWPAFWMFFIVFLWTPPHVWALAIHLKDDYARAGIPMLPVVKGVEETCKQIFIYALVMVAGPIALPLVSDEFAHSWVYLASSVILGAIFLVWSWRIWKRRPRPDTMPLFFFSILYIGLIFLAMIVDVVIQSLTV